MADAAKTRAELDAARARLAVLRAGSRREEVERLGAAVSRKQLELAQARDPQTKRARLQAAIDQRSTELTYAQQTLTRLLRPAQCVSTGNPPRCELDPYRILDVAAVGFFLEPFDGVCHCGILFS